MSKGKTSRLGIRKQGRRAERDKERAAEVQKELDLGREFLRQYEETFRALAK